jgi:hypothetical protein
MAELKTCAMKLTRIGDAEGEIVETQHRATVPTVGDVVEVSADGAHIRARVTRISPPSGSCGLFTIDVDELSSGYLWEITAAMVQSDDCKLSSGALSAMPPKRPHLALEATLKLARQCHALARQAVERPNPDLAAAKRYVKLACRAGRLATPYLHDEELRRRIVGYKPMSEEEWEHLWPSTVEGSETVGE